MAPPVREIKRNRALAAALAVDDRHRYEIAAEADIDASYLSRLTTGRQKATPQVAARVAAALNADVAELFPDVAEFVSQVRARRVASGRPDYIDDEAVYRVLDGVLAHAADTTHDLDRK